ncbi:MAG TPA: SMP-30/gluconolactonase/LRE family protein [Planctomycetota bacterium]|nr:SMP-30/gluconolactonase/LRE family protein [Planctomycetota bacterium]
MKTLSRSLAVSLMLAACALVAAEPDAAAGHEKDKLWNGWGMTPSGQVVPLTNLAKFTPAGDPDGVRSVNSDLPLRFVLSPDGKFLLAACGGYNRTGLAILSIADKKVTHFFPLPEVFNGLAFDKEGQRVFVSSGDLGELHVFKYDKEKSEFTKDKPVKAATAAQTGPAFLSGIAVHPTTGKLYVCNEANHEIWVIDPQTLQCEASIPVELHPHSCIFGGDKRHLYVSNWGSRSVSVIDTQTGKKVRDLRAGIRPNDMALSPDGRLFVACSGDNTVYVIQTRTLEAEEIPANTERRLPDETHEILNTALYPQSPEGSTPDAVAVSPDGKTLYVANADNNNVMVIDIHDPKKSQLAGFIPVGWYPSALAVTPDSGTLMVANGKGVQSHPSAVPPEEGVPKGARQRGGIPFMHPGKLFEGSVEFIARPDAAALERYTAQAHKNSPYTPEMLHKTANASTCCIPDKVGAPCPIKYVLYIIKENRTYDQVLGDLKNADGKPLGNGDSALTLYGENVTPNQHQLAREYVVLDNFYCNGEVSVDGHDWCDGAIVTDAKQRAWILSYSKHGKLPANDEMMVPAGGYLWDNCKRHGLSFKCYGEGAARVTAENRGTWKGKRDTERAEGWIADLHAAEKDGNLPRLMIMSLGENHTTGTKPGTHTPDACVASNDLALGRIVEASSKSKFWSEMAIFVVEDDPQNGPDHVDCHRTVASVYSPWVRRGTVDSTQYTQVGMIRTMELILGLPPMTQYDAAAVPMFATFQNKAEAVAYQARDPKVDLSAINGVNAPGAKKSAMMNFDDYDDAPEDELNRILWVAAKGENVPYPPIVRRALVTP